MLHRILTRLRQANILLNRYSYTNPPMEIIYRELFLLELARANVADRFYPVGGAASHSLMYFIARVMNELDVRNIVELGAGQTTVLLDRMKRATGRDCMIHTIEHDASWVELIRPSIEHSIRHAPLRAAVADGVPISFYDADSGIISRDVDLAIIDGPPASRMEERNSRLGAFDLLKDNLATDFIVVIDDWERAGEMRLASLFESHFTNRKIDYATNTLRANKSQAVFAAGRFRQAAFF